MKINLTEDLPVIHKKGIREAYLENQRGEIWILRTRDYKQLLKHKEYVLVCKAAGISPVGSAPVAPVAEIRKPIGSKEEKVSKKIEAGSSVKWEGKNGETTGKILELIDKDQRARVLSDLDEKVYKVAVKALKLVA